MIEVNDSNYNQVVSQKDKLIIIDFFAPWCGPCRTLSPILDKISKITPDVDFCKIDVDESPDAANANQIRNVPTLIFMFNGKILDRMVGTHSEQTIINKIDQLKTV